MHPWGTEVAKPSATPDCSFCVVEESVDRGTVSRPGGHCKWWWCLALWAQLSQRAASVAAVAITGD
uniref:Uncharacterized protein n=1 Tax=Oryza rufipogon TaxID=4529 RepID=A0A0E0QUA3_ORYRU